MFATPDIVVTPGSTIELKLLPKNSLTLLNSVCGSAEVKRKLEKALLKRTKKLRLGNGLSKTTDVGPLINKKAVEKSYMYVNVARKEGAKLLYGGEKGNGKGHFFQPTIFTNVTKKMRIAQEEVFGPVLSIVPVKSFDEAVEVANSIRYGLSSSVYTNDLTNSFKAIQKLDTGITYINSSTIGAEVHLPFGGMKDTGNGVREAGIVGIEEFSEVKTIYIDYSGKLQKAQGID